MTALVLYALLALGVSFLCSLLEAGLLSIPRSHVSALVERGSWAGRQLNDMKTHIDGPLAAILTLNTIAHTVGAAGVGAEATTVFGHGALGIASAIITLLILFLSEIIPKTLGATYAKPLAPFTAAATRSMMLVTYPLVVCLTWLNRLLGRSRADATISRAEVRAAVQLGRRSGSLNRKEYRILANLLSLGTIKLHRILTPRTVVFALPAEYSVGRVFAEHATLGFTRIPVFGASRDEIKGYVTRFQLEEAHRAGRDSVLLSELVRPIQTLPEQATAANAMDMMLREHDHISIVIDEHGGFEGIVTLEDLLETLLGTEIVDETDKEVDLQEVARRIASRRGSGRSRRE